MNTISNSSQSLSDFLTTSEAGHEWIQALCFIAVGILFIWLTDRVLRALLNRWLKNFDTDFRNKMIVATRGPVRFFIFVYFFILAFDSFKKMPPLLWQRVHTEYYPIINAVILLVLAFRIVDIVSKVLRVRWASESTSLDERWADLFGYVGKGIVVVAGGMVLLTSFGINILPFLTGVSFFGAAVALASQHTIANAIGSLEIMMDRLFKEGDRISFGEYDGFVTKMGLRSIQLTALTGEKINLPNKDLVDKQIRNFSLNKRVRTSIRIGIIYDCNRQKIEQAMALLEEIVRHHPRGGEAEVSFRKFDQSALDLVVNFWADYKTAAEYYQLITSLHLEIKERFDAARIEFAFPTSTIILKNDLSQSPK